MEIEINEYIRTPRVKPSQEVIEALHKQKIKILSSKMQDIDFKQGFEFEFAQEIEGLKERGKKREERIREIIEDIKEIQKQKNITEFQRNFLNTLLKQYTRLNEKTIQRVVTNLLQYANVREFVVPKKYLEVEERKQGVKETRWREHFEIKQFYSFL